MSQKLEIAPLKIGEAGDLLEPKTARIEVYPDMCFTNVCPGCCRIVSL